MPELAEVEVVRRALEQRVVGQTALSSSASAPRSFTGPLDLVLPAQCVAVRRLGKFLFLDFDSGQDLLVHLGMSGALLWNAPVRPHERFRMVFSDGELSLVDPRGFGRATAVPHGQTDGSPTLSALGPDPLLPGFDAAAAAETLVALSGPAKVRLLSQRAVAGVGNYMADEACWQAGVAPMTTSMTLPLAVRVVTAVVDIAREALAHGGVSQKDYVHIDGSRGRYGEILRCYGRAGLSCPRCGSLLAKTRVAGRGTTWCPRCQAQ